MSIAKFHDFSKVETLDSNHQSNTGESESKTQTPVNEEVFVDENSKTVEVNQDLLDIFYLGSLSSAISVELYNSISKMAPIADVEFKELANINSSYNLDCSIFSTYQSRLTYYKQNMGSYVPSIVLDKNHFSTVKYSSELNAYYKNIDNVEDGYFCTVQYKKIIDNQTKELLAYHLTENKEDSEKRYEQFLRHDLYFSYRSCPQHTVKKTSRLDTDLKIKNLLTGELDKISEFLFCVHVKKENAQRD